MSASLTEVREQVDALLHMLHVRIKSGRLIIHIDEYRAQRVETAIVHRPIRGDVDIDKRTGVGAE